MEQARDLFSHRIEGKIGPRPLAFTVFMTSLANTKPNEAEDLEACCQTGAHEIFLMRLSKLRRSGDLVPGLFNDSKSKFERVKT